MALAVIETEAQAVFELSQRIDERFEKACSLLLACEGHIIVTGIGKSGHIANKMAATLSSTGTPAFFMHAAEAIHGDLGMIRPKDIVIAISSSGTTPEIVTLIPLFKRLQIPLITLTGAPNSTLAKAADVNLDVSIHQEACPLGLAPTTSTTVTLVMADALAVALLQARGFDENDFALSHPGGALGRRLLLRIDDISHKGDEMPVIHEHASVAEALIEVTEKKLGMTCVVNKQGILSGVYTDGDIRRTLTQAFDINTTSLSQVMSKNCKTIKKDLLAAEALAIMQEFRITSLVVVDEHQRPEAVVHLHDLLRAGVI
jgi:arabinose-5-phosphate isomerase